MNPVVLDTIRHNVNSLVDIMFCNHAESISYSESYSTYMYIDEVTVSTKYSHVYRSNAHNCIDQFLTCISIKYSHPDQVALLQCSNQVLSSVLIKHSQV